MAIDPITLNTRFVVTKPILFNTEMVRAILEGRKTQTRRIAKALCFTEKRCDGLIPSEFCFFISPRSGFVYWKDIEKMVLSNGKPIKAPYMPGDILWVQETWCENKNPNSDNFGGYEYCADYDICRELISWKRSIYMPKKAARIFLRVTDVRVERLQECGKGWCLEIEKEGVETKQDPILYVSDDKYHDALRAEFRNLWNSTIKKADLPLYGWDANPWVWAIEFERCEKPEGWCE